MRFPYARTWVGFALAMVLAAALAGDRSPAAAEPAQDGRTVTLYPQPDYRGTPRTLRLPKDVEGETWFLFDRNHRDRSKYGSLRVGRWVGDLLQEAAWGDPHYPTAEQETVVYLRDVPDLGLWKGHALRQAVVFLSAKVGDRARGEVVRIREYPDGAEFAKYRLHHVQGGGSEIRFPAVFVTSDARSDWPPNTPASALSDKLYREWRGSISLYFVLGRGGGYDWLRVYGRSTVVILTSRNSRKYYFTSKGEPYAEYKISQHVARDSIADILVRTRVLKIVPGDSSTGLLNAAVAARDYWVYAGGHFIKTTGNAWEVYAQGRKVRSLQEVKRTVAYVELKSTRHALWVRLRNDSSWVLDPNRGASDWTKQYVGQWRDRPREGTVRPGAPSLVAPDGPAALMRKVPGVLGLTREKAELAVRAVGLLPVFRLIPGGSGNGTRVVAQSPTRGAALAVGGRVTMRYRNVYYVQRPSSPSDRVTDPAARTFWTYKDGHFIKRAGGTWDVFVGDRRVFTLEEMRRTKSFVELHSRAHSLTVRLRADSSWVLDPKRGASAWQKQYDGQWASHPGGGH